MLREMSTPILNAETRISIHDEIINAVSFICEKKDADGKISDYEIDEATLRNYLKRNFKISENVLTKYEKFLTDMIAMIAHEIPMDQKDYHDLIEAFRKADILLTPTTTTSQPSIAKLIFHKFLILTALVGAFLGLWQLMVHGGSSKEFALIDDIILGFFGLIAIGVVVKFMGWLELFHNIRQHINIRFFKSTVSLSQDDKEKINLIEKLEPTILGYLFIAKEKGQTYYQTLLFILNVYAELMEVKLKIIAPVSNNVLQLLPRDDAPLHHEMLSRIEIVNEVVNAGTFRLSM